MQKSHRSSFSVHIREESLVSEANHDMSTLTATLEVLQSGDFHARWDAAKLLPSFGEQAIAPLAQLVQDPDSDSELQWIATRALGEFQHPDALMALATLLGTTEDDEISDIAAETLGSIGAAAIPVFEDYLQTHPTTLPAIQALAHIRDATTLPLLLPAAQHEQAEIRTAAMEALSAFHQPQILPVLIKGLSDPSPDVRQISVTGLGYWPNETLDWIAMIQPLLQDDSLKVSQQTAWTLGRLQLIQPLLERLKTEGPIPLKLTIIQALGQIGTRQALQGLHQIFSGSVGSESLELTRGVIDAIATTQTQQPFATQLLIDILDQPQSAISLNATLLKTIATALGQLGQTEAMEPLIQLLAQPDIGVRLHAIAALKHLENNHVYTRLQTLAHTPKIQPELAEGIAIALQEW